MASTEQLNAYTAQCSDFSIEDFRLSRSTEYDPSSEDYYEVRCAIAVDVSNLVTI